MDSPGNGSADSTIGETHPPQDYRAQTPHSIKTVALMHCLIEKYTQGFHQHTPGPSRPTGETVLLTGSTGGLGSYALEALVLDPNVQKIYVLNRPNTRTNSMDRQKSSFKLRHIDPTIVGSKKIHFVEGHLGTVNLGLESHVWENLRREVTCIMHMAWAVNFTAPLLLFEASIAGTRDLINLALASHCATPPRFLFASSITVARNYPNEVLPESAIDDPMCAYGTGYWESKWIAEQILSRARLETTLRPVIIRIGQLCGGRGGYWSTSEWFPSGTKSSLILGCVPRLPGVISIIPVHVAASVFVEARLSNEPFMHIVHPRPIRWNHLMDLMCEALGSEQVEYSEWLDRLVASASQLGLQLRPGKVNLKTHPLLIFLALARDIGARSLPENSDSFGHPLIDTTIGERETKSLHPSRLQPLGEKEVGEWISAWREVGFLDEMPKNYMAKL